MFLVQKVLTGQFCRRRCCEWRRTRVLPLICIFVFSFAQMEVKIVNVAIIFCNWCSHWSLCRRSNNFNFRVLFEQQTVIQALIDNDINFFVVWTLSTRTRRPPNLQINTFNECLQRKIDQFSSDWLPQRSPCSDVSWHKPLERHLVSLAAESSSTNDEKRHSAVGS